MTPGFIFAASALATIAMSGWPSSCAREAVAFAVSVARWPVVYAALSAVAALMALAAVVNAFVQDPALWPSEFWRYAGAVLNGAGCLACLTAVLAYFRWKR